MFFYVAETVLCNSYTVLSFSMWSWGKILLLRSFFLLGVWTEGRRLVIVKRICCVFFGWRKTFVASLWLKGFVELFLTEPCLTGTRTYCSASCWRSLFLSLCFRQNLLRVFCCGNFLLSYILTSYFVLLTTLFSSSTLYSLTTVISTVSLLLAKLDSQVQATCRI